MNLLIFFSGSPELFIEDKDVVDAYADAYYNYNELTDCYEKNNTLEANLDSNELCVFLYATGNEQCANIPKGIYLDIEISNWQDRFMRVEFIDFDYRTSTQLCAECPEVNGVKTCEFLKYTDSTKMVIRTLIYAAEIVVGKLELGHADLSACFNVASGAMRYGQNMARLDLKWNGYCDGATTLCGSDFSAIDVQFYEGDTLYHSEELASYTSTRNAEGFLIDYPTNVDMFLQRVLSRVDIELSIACQGGLTAKYLTAVAAFGSIDLRSLMLNPILVFYPNKIVITHEPVSNAEEMEQKMNDIGVASVQLLLRLFNKQTDSYYFSLEYRLPTFSFLTDEDKTFACSDTADEAACIAALRETLLTDKTNCQMNVLVYYLDADGKVLIIGSEALEDIRDACWMQVYATYYRDYYCLNLQKSDSQACPFNAQTDVEVIIEFFDPDNVETTDEYVYSKQYSTAESELCFSCSEMSQFENNSTCGARLTEYYEQGRQLRMQMLDSTEPLNSETIDILNTYNSDYTKLYEIVIYCGCAVAGIAAVLIVLEVVGDLGCCKTKKIKEKIEKADDLDRLM